MNQLSTAKRVQVIAALVEGNSIRSTERMTGVAKHTILHLLADIGQACAHFQDISEVTQPLAGAPWLEGCRNVLGN
jgi:transposase-like protein